MRAPQRKNSPKRRQRKHSDFEAAIQPETVKKQTTQHREERPEIRENEGKVAERNNLS